MDVTRIGSLNAYRGECSKHMNQDDECSIRKAMLDIVETVLPGDEEPDVDLLTSLGVVVACVQEYIDMRTLLIRGGEAGE